MAPKDPKLDLLKSIPIFEGLGEHQLEQIAQLVDEADVPAGKVLMRQGEPGDEMFIVVHGNFTIDRDGNVIRDCSAGHALGELNLLSQGLRSATVTANEPSRVLVVGHREFHALLEVAPEIARHMLVNLARQLRALDEDAVA
ncbi:MAG: cyclic nucleotide-binding domain-containing protein [Chloroflexota bacterium]|nr:MAG: cyclic nucleotide-binding domain-containing protein [Chloroflexota bacterium]